MLMDRVLILGARGMLGTDLAQACDRADIEARADDLPELDITDKSDLADACAGEKLIINCAAFTDVDGAESDKDSAFAVNADAVAELGRVAKEVGAKVLHISTDFVFDGKKQGTYNENDKPCPINVYGKSKLKGEQLLAQSGAQHCIIRVQWTYGLHGNNFIKKILAAARSGRPLKVVDDQIGSPTWTAEAAMAIVSMLPNLPEGIYHYAASGYASRCEVADFIVKTMGFDVDVAGCGSDEFKTAAQRPLNSKFDCSRISRHLNKPIRHWKEPLKEFLELL
jgi:dTDP-4-dehydrorhamnose reductase